MPPKPLVFIPGLPGSVILDEVTRRELFPNLLNLLDPGKREALIAELSGPDDPDADDGVVPGDPIDSLIPGIKSSFIDFSGSLKLADSLYDLLAGFGYSQFSRPFGDRFRPLGWDWRRPVDQERVQRDLQQAIADLHRATGERVVLLCHSTGGQVARGLLERSPEIVDQLDRLIAIGVPWVGTLQSLPYLAGLHGFFPLSSSQTQHILGHSWAAFDLLPPDPAKTSMTDAEGDLDFFTKNHVQTSPLVETAWIPAGPAGHPLSLRASRSDTRLGRRAKSLALGGRRLEVVNFVGWGGSTLTGCEMDAQGNLSFATSDEGDGTIPRRSAAWLAGEGVKTFFVPVGHYAETQITREHSALWLNPPIRDLLGALLAGRDRPPYTYAAVDGDDAINPAPQVHVRVVAQDADGNALPEATAQVFDLSPPTDPQFPIPSTGHGVLAVSRASIQQKAAGGFFRFEVQIHWNEGGQAQSGPRQALLIQKPG